MILGLLKRVCRSLDEKDIPYMISGSLAMNIYSIPRMTRDIDIVIELNEARINDFVALFPDSYFSMETIKDEVKKQGMFNIIDHRTGFKMDFIIRKDTLYFKQAFERRQRIKELDTEMWIISLEDLIIAKIFWIQSYQSEKQIQDIKNLMLNPDRDIDYLRNWCINLNLQTFDLLQNE